ncbi:hypothetical protein JRG18_01385 [Kocuria palustris]|uniref:hypothetical protein n=1 Tax=Kocuria palustris TaxID=71999 RepID=UPI0019D0BA29|nr:hypothetical protein [Kocuria palustris]MBN6752188.1 hypothetical protein [Kocuria palustris]MBN6757143.1 hypothetical protein [Kocuria palustris]MBN6762171.1 hypothetical protein [Kocuria palustris]MBN6781653.1 hypothetical protein [Kocuria palustris]MBN6798137.1 hypothetical protein [Kocuria palustris]
MAEAPMTPQGPASETSVQGAGTGEAAPQDLTARQAATSLPAPGGSASVKGPSAAATARLVVGLKARLTAAAMRRSTWTLVGTILGGLYLLGLVVFWGGMAWVGGGGAEPRAVAVPVVLVGAAATIGWWVASLVTGRADATVHARRFALYPVPRSGLALGQLLSAAVGLAGPFTLLGLLALSLAWRATPIALISSLVLIPVAWGLMVLGNRCLAAGLEGLQRSRLLGDAASVLGLALLVLMGPVIGGLTGLLAGGGLDLERIAAGVSWTPWGALWAIPADMTDGFLLHAAGRLAVVAATGIVVWLLWARLLERSLEHSMAPVRGTASRVRGAGLLGRVPATPWAAVAGRSIIYWLKDPRYAASIVLIPVMLGLLWFNSGPGEGGPLLFAGPLVAAMMGFTISADVAYDHSAFSLHVLSGIRGRDDRLGRLISLCVVGGALSIAALLFGAAMTQTWHLLPGVIGMSLLGLLGGGGISSVLSARYTYPVPLPGDSPLKTPPGFTFLNVLVQMAVMVLIGAVTMLAGIPLVVQMITGQDLWGWLGLAVGVIGGLGLAWGGVVLGGRWLEARASELYQQVSSYRS